MWKILHDVTSNDINSHDIKVQFQLKSRTGTQAVVPSLTVNSLKSHQSLYDNSSFAVLGPKLWIPYLLNSLTQLGVFIINLTTFLLTVPDKPPVKGSVKLYI